MSHFISIFVSSPQCTLAAAVMIVSLHCKVSLAACPLCLSAVGVDGGAGGAWHANQQGIDESGFRCPSRENNNLSMRPLEFHEFIYKYTQVPGGFVMSWADFYTFPASTAALGNK